MKNKYPKGRRPHSKERIEKQRSSLKKYYQEHPNVQAGKNNPNYKNGIRIINKQKQRENHLKRTYGITLDVYNQMFKKQQGSCAICEKHQSQLTHALSVDHNHRTQEIRGLLCKNCNAALGQFNGDTSSRLLRKAIGYLKENNR